MTDHLFGLGADPRRREIYFAVQAAQDDARAVPRS